MKNVKITTLMTSWIQMEVSWPGGIFHRGKVLTYSFALQWKAGSSMVVIVLVPMEAEIKEIFFIAPMLHLKSWWAVGYLFLLLLVSTAVFAPCDITIPVSNVLNSRASLCKKISKNIAIFSSCIFVFFSFTTCSWIKLQTEGWWVSNMSSDLVLPFPYTESKVHLLGSSYVKLLWYVSVTFWQFPLLS